MSCTMVLYRLYDVADNIDLNKAQDLWSASNQISSRLRLARVSPKAIAFKAPPLTVELGMQVVGHHLVDQRGHVKTHMARTASKVQHAGVSLARQFGLQQGKFGALGVHSAAQIGRGLFTELFLNNLAVLGGAGHAEYP